MSAVSGKMLDGVRWVHLALTIVVSGLCMTSMDIMFGLGVLTGGVLSLANFEALRWLGQKVLAAKRRTRGFYVFLFLGKMTVIFSLVWWVLGASWVSPLAFVVGFSVLLVAIAVISLRVALEPAETAMTGGQP